MSGLDQVANVVRAVRLGALALISVVAIAGITAALFIHSQKDSADQLKACRQEYKTVQAALDSYMAYFDLSTVTALSTNDMSVKPDGAHPLYNASWTPNSPTFIHSSPMTWAYTWGDTGRITAIAAVPGGPYIPAGCVVAG